MASPTDPGSSLIRALRPQRSTSMQAGPSETLTEYFRRVGTPRTDSGPAPTDYRDFSPGLSGEQWNQYWDGGGASSREHAKHRQYVDRAMSMPIVTPEMVTEHDDLGEYLRDKASAGSITGADVLDASQKWADASGVNGKQARSDAMALIYGEKPSADMNDPRHAETVNWMRDSVLDVMQSGSPRQVYAKFDPRTSDEADMRSLTGPIVQNTGRWHMTPGVKENFDRQWAYDVLRATHDGAHAPPYADRSQPFLTAAAAIGSEGARETGQIMLSKHGPEERLALSNYWAERGDPGREPDNKAWGEHVYKDETGAYYPSNSVTNTTGLMDTLFGDQSSVPANLMSRNMRFGEQWNRNAIANMSLNAPGRDVSEILGYGDRPQPLLPPGVDPANAQQFGNIVHNMRNDANKSSAYLPSFWPNLTTSLERVGRGQLDNARAEAGQPPMPEPDPSKQDYTYAPPAAAIAAAAVQGMATPMALVPAVGTAVSRGAGAAMSAAAAGPARGAMLRGLTAGGKAAAKTLPAMAGQGVEETFDELREEGAQQLAGPAPVTESVGALFEGQPDNALMSDAEGYSIPAQHPSTLDPLRREALERQAKDFQTTIQAYRQLKK